MRLELRFRFVINRIPNDLSKAELDVDVCLRHYLVLLPFHRPLNVFDTIRKMKFGNAGLKSDARVSRSRRHDGDVFEADGD